MGGEHTRRVRAGSIELTLLEQGAGGRPLLILHGFCGAKENWAEVMGPLSGNGWHVVVPDQRGHGASDHPAGKSSYRFETFVEDAIALTDALEWDHFVLLGHSMGGMTAQLLALDDPSKLDGMILVDTFHSRIEIEADAVALGRQIVESGGMQALVDSMRGLEDPLVTQAHLRLLAERPGYQELLDSQTLACSPEMWVAMTTEMFGARDLLEDLRSLRVPTLVAVGEQDKPFLDSCIRISRAVPGARLEVITDAGHSPQLEAPEAWLAAVTSFLGSV